MNKKHRIFIAINLPEDIKKELSKYQDKWSELPAKWTAKDNLHITLEFLGDLTDEELGEVCLVVKEVSQRHCAFSISLDSVSYGPPKKIPPRMVWAEGSSITNFDLNKQGEEEKIGNKSKLVMDKKSDEIVDLKEDLQEYLLERVSFRPESKSFSPHITLARINEWQWKKIEPEERPEVDENIDFVFTVESIEVMESELKKGGPQYTIIESHSLKD